MYKVGKNFLFLFIQSLSKEEKSVIVKRFRQQSRKRTLKEELFHLIDRGKGKQLLEITKQTSIKTQQVAIVKRDLLGDMLQFLADNDAAFQPHQEILSWKDKADSLFEREFYKESYMYFTKAYQRSVEMERFDIQRQLLDQYSKYRLVHSFESTAAFLRFIIQEKKNIVQRITDYEYLKMEFHGFYEHIESERKSEFQLNYALPDKQYEGVRCNYWHQLTLYNYYLYQKNATEKLHQVLEQIVHIMEGHPFLIQENPQNFLIVLRDYTMNLIDQEAPYKTILLCLNKFEEITQAYKIRLSKRHEELRYNIIIESSLRASFQFKNHSIRSRVLELERNYNIEKSSLNPWSFQSTSANFASFFYQESNQRRCHFWLEQLYGVKDVFIGGHYSAHYYILKMLLLLDEENESYLSLYNSARRTIATDRQEIILLLKELKRYKEAKTTASQREKIQEINKIVEGLSPSEFFLKSLKLWITRENSNY